MSFFLVSLLGAIAVGLLRSLALTNRGRRAAPLGVRPCPGPGRPLRRPDLAVDGAA
jgi:hypothetical protein